MPLLIPQHHQPGVSIWFLVPGLPWCEDISICHQAKLVSTHSLWQGRSSPPSLSFHSKNALCMEVTHWICDLARVWAYFPSPFTQGDFPVSSTEDTNQNLNYLNSDSWGTESSTMQFSVVQPCRSGSQTFCDGEQGFPVCAQLSLPVTSAPRSGWASSFRASALCHLTLIRIILKGWCHSISRVLSIRRLNLREMESSLCHRGGK